MEIKEVCCCAADIDRDLKPYVGDFFEDIFFIFSMLEPLVCFSMPNPSSLYRPMHLGPMVGLISLRI